MFDSWYQRRRYWLRDLQTRSWLRVQAVIRSADVEEIVEPESGSHVGWKPTVRFVYQVNNVAHSGVTTGELWFYDEHAARETAADLTNRTLPIRCHPLHPERCSYIPTDGGPPQLTPAIPDSKTGLITIPLK
jgi:hypothetical protein